jgi:DNA repair exonuclease SbcCD ATPase subunit
MNPTANPVNAGPIATDFGCVDQTMGLIRDLEQELDRIRHAQSGQAAEFEAMRSRWGELFDRESSLSHGFAALEERERWLAAQAGAIERRANDLAARETAFGFDRLELDRRLREIEVLDARHVASDEAVQALERELERVRQDAISERRELTGRIGELDSERRRLSEAVAALESTLRAAQASRAAAESDSVEAIKRTLDERTAEVARLETERVDATSRAGEADRRIAALESKLKETRSALDSAKVELAKVQKQAGEQAHAGEQLAASTAKIAELEQRLAAEQVAVEGERNACATLRDELDRAKSNAKRLEAAAQGAVERKSKELTSELAGAKSRLDRAESEAASLRRELTDAKTRIERDSKRMASLQRELDEQAAAGKETESYRTRIATLEQQCDASRDRAVSLESELEAARASLEQAKSDRARFEKELADAKAVVATPDPKAFIETERLEARVRDLAATVAERDARLEVLAGELEAARAAAKAASSTASTAAPTDAIDRGVSREQAERLQEKVRQLGRYATMLRLRRERLRRVRQALSERRARLQESAGSTGVAAPVAGGASGSSQAMLHELRQVQAKREELRQVQKFLAESEVRMVRRWAARRGMSLAMSITLFLGTIFAAAWFAADFVWPTPGTASVDLIARGPKGQPLDPRLADGWKAWHTALFSDPLFAEEVSKRLATRGFEPNDPASVSSMLTKDLAVDSDGPGRLRLVLSGTDRTRLPILLDTVATTLAAESAEQATRRPDQTPAIVLGDRVREGKVAYSLLDPRPVDLEQVSRAGMLAGGMAGIATILAIPTILVLRRVRRVIEVDQTPLVA